MKKIQIIAMVALCATTVLLAGCSTLFNSPETAYDAGSKAAGLYAVGRPFIPDQEREIIREVYLVIRDSDDIAQVTDELIRNAIALKAAKFDEATQQGMVALFVEAHDDLQRFLNKSGTPEEQDAIKTAFFKGIEDRLAVHNIQVSKNTDKAALLELIDTMGADTKQ